MVQEKISVFDMFKIGIGPSSSHTLGPWRAAERFLNEIPVNKVKAVRVFLYGSLAKTGKGHGTDVAVMLGLSGEDPVRFDTQLLHSYVQNIRQTRRIRLAGNHEVPFDVSTDLVFLRNESLPFHPNAIRFYAQFTDESSNECVYYSVGGGFVLKEGETTSPGQNKRVPYEVNDADELLQNCMRAGFNISQLVMENEKADRPENLVNEGLLHIWNTMKDSIYRGCHASGILPGGLNVLRRAEKMNRQLLSKRSYNNINEWLHAVKQGNSSFSNVMNWVSCFALAVNEENASFGRVVTAPTNGAAGVVPSVLLYYHLFAGGEKDQDIIAFLLTASEIGSLFKKGSTISAAMGGCQAEIGVSSAMAAGALAERLGGTPHQVLQAAEIAMEHHLGMTCDPIGGLVQIPCIERNTMGAIKAIMAAQLALQTDADQMKVSLDNVIKTMWDTAKDMSSKYKETADGGLAIHIPLNLPEC